jgi:hypothetical protein
MVTKLEQYKLLNPFFFKESRNELHKQGKAPTYFLVTQFFFQFDYLKLSLFEIKLNNVF